MFNIGPQELLLILVLALLVVGPKRLPEIAKTVGRGVRELRKAQDEVRKTIQVNLDEPAPTRGRTPTSGTLPVDAAEDLPGADAAVVGADGDGGPTASGSDIAAPAAAASATTAATEPSPVSEVSRTLGRTLAELRRAREEVQRSFRVDLDAPPPARPRTSKPAASSGHEADPPPASPPATAEASGSSPSLGDDDRPA